MSSSVKGRLKKKLGVGGRLWERFTECFRWKDFSVLSEWDLGAPWLPFIPQKESQEMR